MDVVAAVSGYISKMVTAGESATGSSSKMKILLLDSETVGHALNQFEYEDRFTDSFVGIGTDCFDRHYPVRTPES